MRETLLNVKMLKTLTQDIILNKEQFFCRTSKAYEIWQIKPLRRIKRIPCNRIFWVIEK